MLVDRRTTRVVKDTVEVSREAATPESNVLSMASFATDKYLYLGFRERFTTRFFQISAANDQASLLTVEFYQDASTWTEVEDLVDQTESGGASLAQSGFVSWEGAPSWVKHALSYVPDVELYWVRLSWSAQLGSDTALQSILNLFVDDSLLSEYYPELVSDADYLPSGQTTFIKQYQAATKLICTKLKQKGTINDPSQIIDVNEVAVAAAHAAAYVILNGIPGKSEKQAEAASDAYDAMLNELSKTRIEVDLDDSGLIEDAEQRPKATVYIPRA